MVPTAAAVTASSPISAPVGTTIWPPCARASAIRSSFWSNAPALSTIAVLPRLTTGATICLTSLLGAHSTTMSAASASASSGSIFGFVARSPSQPRCLSAFWAETAASSSPSIPRSSSLTTFPPMAPRPATATLSREFFKSVISPLRLFRRHKSVPRRTTRRAGNNVPEETAASYEHFTCKFGHHSDRRGEPAAPRIFFGHHLPKS